MGCGSSKNVVSDSRKNGNLSGAEMMFVKYDHDNSGHISKSEFKDLCLAMGYRLTEEEANVSMELIGGQDKQISKAEFVKWWQTDRKFEKLQWTPSQLETIQKVQESFKKFDKDGSGFIEKDEFRTLHKLLTESKLTTKTMEETMKELDENNDGKIDYTEYVRYLLNHLS